MDTFVLAFLLFIDFIITGKTFLDYTNLLSPKKYEKNDIIILKYLQ